MLEEKEEDGEKTCQLQEEEREGNSMSICRMLIKCADIANPTRDWALCQRWAMRIVSEYFDQVSSPSSPPPFPFPS